MQQSTVLSLSRHFTIWRASSDDSLEKQAKLLYRLRQALFYSAIDQSHSEVYTTKSPTHAPFFFPPLPLLLLHLHVFRLFFFLLHLPQFIIFFGTRLVPVPLFLFFQFLFSRLSFNPLYFTSSSSSSSSSSSRHSFFPLFFLIAS